MCRRFYLIFAKINTNTNESRLDSRVSETKDKDHFQLTIAQPKQQYLNSRNIFAHTNENVHNRKLYFLSFNSVRV